MCSTSLSRVSGQPSCVQPRPKRRVLARRQEGLRDRVGDRLLRVVRQSLAQVGRSRQRQEERKSQEGAEEVARLGRESLRSGSRFVPIGFGGFAGAAAFVGIK